MSRLRRALRWMILSVCLVGGLTAYGGGVWLVIPAQVTLVTRSVDGPHDRIYERETIVSPAGGHVAVAQRGEDHWLLDGRDDFEIWVGKSDAPRASLELAFSSQDSTDVAWIDEHHLVLTPGSWKGRPFSPPPDVPPRPIVMLRNVTDVTVSYRVADHLLEPAYRRGLEQWEQWDREHPSFLPLSMADDPEKNLAQTWAFVQRHWAEYLAFREWVSGNTDSTLGEPPVRQKPDYDSEEAFPSHDGNYVAFLRPSHKTEAPAGSASYALSVGKRNDPEDSRITVFHALDGMPDVDWADAKTLVITVNRLSHVRMSLHQAGDVRITYRLADRMREADFRARLDRWKRDSEDDERPRKLRPTETHAKNLAELERRFQRQWDEYRQFQDWVHANVAYGGG